jgi:hypothetical protein
MFSTSTVIPDYALITFDLTRDPGLIPPMEIRDFRSVESSLSQFGCGEEHRAEELEGFKKELALSGAGKERNIFHLKFPRGMNGVECIWGSVSKGFWISNLTYDDKLEEFLRAEIGDMIP